MNNFDHCEECKTSPYPVTLKLIILLWKFGIYVHEEEGTFVV